MRKAIDNFKFVGNEQKEKPENGVAMRLLLKLRLVNSLKYVICGQLLFADGNLWEVAVFHANN